MLSTETLGMDLMPNLNEISDEGCPTQKKKPG